jgi:signal transduction histidine kinase
MRLAAQLVAILLAGVALLLSLDGYLAVSRETEFFQRHMSKDALTTGVLLKDLVAEVWRVDGQAEALRFVKEANRAELSTRIRWTWLQRDADHRYWPLVDLGSLAPVIHGETKSFTITDGENQRLLVTYVPLRLDQARVGALELSKPFSELEKFARSTMIRNLTAIGVLVLASVPAVVLLGATLLGRPLHRLVAKVRRVGQGDLSGPVRLGGRNELAELGSAINAMCEQLAESHQQVREETAARITTLAQLHHADRLATVGQLASGVAHELGTPLTVVAARAKLIAGQRLGSAETVDNANIIRAQAERIAGIIRQLLDFAGGRPGQPAAVDLHEIVRRTVDLLTPLAGEHRAELTVAFDGADAPVEADAAQIQQVLMNLTVNAIQAMPQGGKVVVRVAHERTKPPDQAASESQDYVRLDVIDEGGGIAEENLSRVFEPFFTTKDVGEGTGLGLSISYGIVRQHGGWIGVTSSLGKGSRFSVYLPGKADHSSLTNP